MNPRRFFCEYCEVGFVTESRFLKHKCKQMKRAEEFRTVTGTAAWNFYQEWMRVQKRSVPRSDAFLHSNFYNAFIRFAEFVKRVRLPEPNKFIRFAVREDFPPVMWTTDSVYGRYLVYIDHRGDPLDQLRLTIKTLEELEEEYQCDISEVFSNVPPNIIIHLIRTRSLTPWILLQSPKFLSFLRQVSSEERVIMNSIIRPDLWKKKFHTQKTITKRMKEFVPALGL